MRKGFSVNLTDEEFAKLKHLAEERNITPNQFVERILKTALARVGDQ